MSYPELHKRVHESWTEGKGFKNSHTILHCEKGDPKNT